MSLEGWVLFPLIDIDVTRGTLTERRAVWGLIGTEPQRGECWDTFGETVSATRKGLSGC